MAAEIERVRSGTQRRAVRTEPFLVADELNVAAGIRAFERLVQPVDGEARLVRERLARNPAVARDMSRRVRRPGFTMRHAYPCRTVQARGNRRSLQAILDRGLAQKTVFARIKGSFHLDSPGMPVRV